MIKRIAQSEFQEMHDITGGRKRFSLIDAAQITGITLGDLHAHQKAGGKGFHASEELTFEVDIVELVLGFSDLEKSFLLGYRRPPNVTVIDLRRQRDGGLGGAHQ